VLLRSHLKFLQITLLLEQYFHLSPDLCKNQVKPVAFELKIYTTSISNDLKIHCLFIKVIILNRERMMALTNHKPNPGKVGVADCFSHP